ncbi:MAG: hypothetical protein Kow0042_10880 [Calditrichia bacterium]
MAERTTQDVILCIDCAEDFREEAVYVFRQLFTAIGLRYQVIPPNRLATVQSPVLIYYGKQKPTDYRGFMIHIATAEYYENMASLNKEALCWMRPADPKLPPRLFTLFQSEMEALPETWYRGESGQPIITAGRSGVNCRADFIGTLFYLLSLQNEITSVRRDHFQRFRVEYSPLGGEIYQIPLLDEVAGWLRSALEYGAEMSGLTFTFTPRWPEGKKFALALFHDVDRLQSWTVSKLKRALVGGGIANKMRKSVALLGSLLRPSNWSGNFAYITDLEKRYGGRSTFFFVAGKKSERDPGYRLESFRLRKGLSRLREEHWPVGLHGTFPSCVDANLLREEKARIESWSGGKVWGNRQHYLRFDAKVTPGVWAESGIAYDNTLGFVEQPGFRTGTSLPFHLWNFAEKKAYSFLEIPLIIMDTGLILKENMNLSADRAWEVVEKYLKETRRRGGLLTVNLHNNNIHPGDVTGYTKLYEKMLKWARDNEGWICAPDEVYKWWQAKYE